MAVDGLVLQAESDAALPLLPAQLPRLEGSWTWIRKANGPSHRAARKDASLQLLDAIRSGGYISQLGTDARTVRLNHVESMLKNTFVLSVSAGLPELPQDPEQTLEFEYGYTGGPVEKAESLAKEGCKVIVVSAASAYQIGGGFLTGGRHALEEAFCSQTTLYPSLEYAADLTASDKTTALSDKGTAKAKDAATPKGQRSQAKKHANGSASASAPKNGSAKKKERGEGTEHGKAYIPVDGCIVSPQVEIFRGGTDQGYPSRLEATAITGVVSVAMFNRNPKIHDSPVDAPAEEAVYEEAVRKKFKAVVHGAAVLGADTLILPDVGCGVFENDPSICGRLAGDVIHEYRGFFKRVVFTGRRAFFDAAAVPLSVASDDSPGEVAMGSRKTHNRGARRTTHGIVAAKNPDNSDKKTTSQARQFCVGCGELIAGAAAVNLSVFVTGRFEQQFSFMHAACGDKRSSMASADVVSLVRLPLASDDPEGFLQALDLHGDGVLGKQELRQALALLWEIEASAFVADFDQRWQEWDPGGTGVVSVAEDDVPVSLVAWVTSKAQSSLASGWLQLPASARCCAQATRCWCVLRVVVTPSTRELKLCMFQNEACSQKNMEISIHSTSKIVRGDSGDASAALAKLAKRRPYCFAIVSASVCKDGGGPQASPCTYIFEAEGAEALAVWVDVMTTRKTSPKE